MNICFGSTGWSHFFYFCEIIMTLALAIVYSKHIVGIYKNQEKDYYEKLDLLIIFLSMAQIVLMLIPLLSQHYFVFSLTLDILKFSENSLIGCLLLIIIMWKHSSIALIIVNYFVLIILIFDLVSFGIGIFLEYPPFELNYCKPMTEIILAILGLGIDLIIVALGIYISLEDSEDEALNLLAEEDQYYINNIFKKYVSSIKKMTKYYLIIIVAFLMSYFIEVSFKIFMTSTGEFPSSETASTVYNNTTIGNSTKNSSVTYTECIYYGNLGKSFLFKEYLICTLSFFFKDLSPHVYIFFALFIFKPKSLSRSSSFIESL